MQLRICDILHFSILKALQIQISWLLMKPSDQDPHCFHCEYSNVYNFTCGMLQVNKIIDRLGERVGGSVVHELFNMTRVNRN